MFFPPSNRSPRKCYVTTSRALASASGHLQIEEHDRLGDAELAGKYKVSKDGMIVLVRNAGDKDKEKSQTIELDTEIEKARKGASKLRNFDREVNKLLMKLVRDKRKAYVMRGHGEITDPDSVPPDLKVRVPERHTTVFKKRLGDLNYEVKDLGLIDLAKDVPDDATIVIMLAPTLPLEPAEWAALERYLDKGGRLLARARSQGRAEHGDDGGQARPQVQRRAADRRSGVPAAARWADGSPVRDHDAVLGARVDHVAVALGRQGPRADRVGRPRGRAGHCEGPAEEDGDHPLDGFELPRLHKDDKGEYNHAFDAASEKRQRWNIAEAIEGPKMKDAAGKDKDGWRVLVFADADLFADALVQNAVGRAAVVLVSGPLLDDSVKWLGGEEVFAGDVVSEDDKPIQHYQEPGLGVVHVDDHRYAAHLVLILGLMGTRFARRRRKSSSEVKP